VNSANFESYAVFVPGAYEGVTSGYELVRVLALNEADAIEKACAEWFGSGAREGTYLVVPVGELVAYEVDEKRIPHVRSQVSVPSGSVVRS